MVSCTAGSESISSTDTLEPDLQRVAGSTLVNIVAVYSICTVFTVQGTKQIFFNHQLAGPPYRNV